MAAVRVIYKITHPENHTKFSGFKGTYKFQNGFHEAILDSGKVQKRTDAMAKYGAYPYDANQANKDAAESGSGSEVPVPGAGGPDGSGPAQEGADDGAGAGGAETGSAGSVPDGDGREDSRDDWNKENDNRLLKAVKSLDPKNDEHWTSHGTPAVAAVEQAFGKAGVKRADVERVAPGYTRPAD